MDCLNKACTYHGPSGSYFPFLKQICFEPAFITNTVCQEGCNGNQMNLNCVNTVSGTDFSNYFDIESPNNDLRCTSGSCATFNSNTPKIIQVLTPEQYIMFARANGQSDQCICPPGKSLLLVQDQYGVQSVGYALNSPCEFQYSPQCQTCLQTVFQCDRFLTDTNNADYCRQYAECKAQENCFIYNAVYPNGSTEPIIVKLDARCKECTNWALSKCEERCRNLCCQ